MKLNLTATDTAQERIKAYFEQNASESLSEKINNGVAVYKDGQRLISRKTLKGFMAYATAEARKIAEKGAQFACVDDATVFGWAVHFFEEDSIMGTLYNEDGTEYKPAPAQKKSEPKQKKIPATPAKATPKPITPNVPTKAETKPSPKKPKTEELEQYTLFDW